jgi:hypothetical protein
MKKSKGLLVCAVLGAWVVLLAGCASWGVGKVYSNTVMDPAVPIEDHAVVYFHPHVHGIVIDGDEAKQSKSTNDEAIIMVAPGLHTVSAYYADVDADRKITSNYMPFDYDFAAGHFYYVSPDVEQGSLFRGGTVSFGVSDETDPASRNDAAEKRVAEMQKFRETAQYPKNTALSVTYGNTKKEAAAAGPTQFEGIWKMRKDDAWSQATTQESYAYFLGKAYRLDLLAILNADVNTTSGTFEFTDSTITLTELQTTDTGFASVSYFLQNRKRPRTVEYTYSLTNPNELVLFEKNKKIGTFVKQQ